MKFERTKLGAKTFPWLAELGIRFKECGDYCKADKECKRFFDGGAALIKSGTIPILKISDYNTTGVTGGDDERGGGWYSLVKSVGTSSKVSTEGGSFGLGKARRSPQASSAPFCTHHKPMGPPMHFKALPAW